MKGPANSIKDLTALCCDLSSDLNLDLVRACLSACIHMVPIMFEWCWYTFSARVMGASGAIVNVKKDSCCF